MKNLLHSSFFTHLDWATGFGCLAWGGYLVMTSGLHANSALWVGGGVLGLLIAWYRPAQRVNQALNRRFVRRRA